MKIVIATSNQNKFREIQDKLKNSDVQLLSLKNFPNIPEVIEDGYTFEENALKKARVIRDYTGLLTVADDSGLEVDCLAGRPGVLSARYAGEEADDKKNYKKLLSELENISLEKRGACFRCVLAIVDPSGREQVVEGTYRGFITREPRGKHGFGYDPVFLDPASGLTFAEMEPAQKNKISHRSSALKEFLKILPGFLGKP